VGSQNNEKIIPFLMPGGWSDWDLNSINVRQQAYINKVTQQFSNSVSCHSISIRSGIFKLFCWHTTKWNL